MKTQTLTSDGQAQPRVKRVVLVDNVRLPTEKAHGLAISKLAEAFGALNVETEVWHPRRQQRDPRLADVSLYDFYGVAPTFTAIQTRNIDVFRVEALMPPALFRALYEVHSRAWSSYIARIASKDARALFVTRDLTCASALVRHRCPTILDLHVVPSRIRLRQLVKISESDALRRIVTLTSHSRTQLVSAGISLDRIVVAGSGLDPSLFDGLGAIARCRALLGLPTDRRIVGYVGRFEALGEEKGIPQLIRAMARLKGRVQPQPLTLCVGGPLTHVKEYRALATRCGLAPDDVFFVDHVPSADVPIWLGCLDVAVSLYPPSEYGAHYASPLKIAEYQAAGVPLVASDLPSMHEAAVTSVPSEFVDADTAEAVALAVMRLLDQYVPRVNTTPARPRMTWRTRAEAILRAAL